MTASWHILLNNSAPRGPVPCDDFLSKSIGKAIAFTIAHMAKLKVFSYIFNGPEAGFIRALSWALL